MSKPRKRILSDAHYFALEILADCEQGATELSLWSLGIAAATLDELVDGGYIKTWIQHLHHPRVDVRWYRSL